RLIMGESLLMLGQWDDAEAELRTVLNLKSQAALVTGVDPIREVNFQLLALRLHRYGIGGNSADLETLASDIETALDEAPGEPRLHHLLGIVYRYLRRYELSLHNIERSVQRQGLDPRLAVDRGIVLIRM